MKIIKLKLKQVEIDKAAIGLENLWQK